MQKTNAMRILDKQKINYQIFEYDGNDFKDGLEVAKAIHKEIKFVYKTIVCISSTRKIYVFIIPVDSEIDLKKAASCVHEKSISLLALEHLEEVTGYIRGGCSPLGMKKNYRTFISSEALKLDKIIVSGGRRGVQIEINLLDLEQVLNLQFINLTRD